MPQIPFNEWAIEKVRTLTPPHKEKGTLIAIARYANHFGKKSYPAIETISKDSGNSIATVKRHIKALADRGEIIVHRQAFNGRSNVYEIMVCRLTEEEREKLKHFSADGNNEPYYISMRQMKLPLPVQQEISESIVTEDAAVEGPVEIAIETEKILAKLTSKFSIENNIIRSSRRSTFNLDDDQDLE